MWAGMDAHFASRGGQTKRSAGGQPVAPRPGGPAKSARPPTAPARRPEAANPFQRVQEAKASKLGAATRGAVGTAAAGPSAPGNVKKKKKPKPSVAAGDPKPLNAAAAAEPAPAAAAADAAPLEPLASLPLPDADQRFVYVGPLRSRDPEPLLRLFEPPSSGPICVSMLHDWTAGGRFLGVASVEFPSAPALRTALAPLLAARGPDGRAPLRPLGGGSVRGLGPALLGQGCGAVRALGARACKEGLQLGADSNAVAGQLGGHTLEMLGACSRGVATAALKEFNAIAGATKTSKTLRQIVRRLQHRAALARVEHTFLWRGEVTGLPLPEGPAKRMRAVLDALDWQALGNNRNPTGQGKINVENSFSLGLATHKLSETGPFSTPFAFRPGWGFWDGGSVKKKHSEVWEAAMELLRSVDPQFHCTSIGFNKNFRGSPHRDEKDSGPQVATALGSYTGGRLRVHTQTGAMDVDTKNRWCRFDGRYEHEVQPFTGTRYSVIFYQLEPSFAVDLSTTVEGSTHGS